MDLKRKTLLEYVQNYLLISFAFFLPISQKISTINIVVLILISLFSLRKKVNFKREYVYLFILYIFYCLSLLYSSEFQFKIMEQKASLVAFPIIFILNRNVIAYFELILKFFVIGCIIALIICEWNAFYNSFDFESFVFDYRVENTLSFYESLRNDKNYFFSYKFSFMHQTVYFSMYLMFSIVILLYNKSIIKNKKIQTLAIFLLFLGVLQTLNKAALLISVFIITIYIHKTINNKQIASIGVILFLIFGLSLFFLNPRFKSFKKSLFETRYEIKVADFRKINNQNPNRGNFRVMLWSSTLDLIKKNPIIGIGAGGSHNRLYEVFAVKRQWYDKSEKYHAHNQYLQILLDLGLLGFVPFFFIIREFKNIFVETISKEKKAFILSTILIIGINFLFESMFERYSGLSFFCFFYCLFISTKNINNKILKHVY